MICDTCKHKTERKETMKCFGVPFVRIEKCTRYEKKGGAE